MNMFDGSSQSITEIAPVGESRILTAQSTAGDAREAVREFHAAVFRPDTALVMFFCSKQYDLDDLASEMKSLFGDVRVVGCTTSGEIGPAGYLDHSITGASFPADSFTVTSGRLGDLQNFGAAQGDALTQALMQELEGLRPEADSSNSFAYLLIDGLSVREEQVARSLQSSLGKVALVGGSAGDGLDFGTTLVYSEGAFHPDSAVVILVSTPLPFMAFKTQHFVPTNRRVVVTSADAEHRIVREIDGELAADAYARLIGTTRANLDPLRFAGQPMVVLIDGTNYVRSIQQVNDDGSLTLFCAIEEGLVLRAAKGENLVKNLEEAFDAMKSEIGQPQLVLACDCILRKLEMTERGLTAEIASVLRANNVVGFSTYGEQFGGVHVNQTLTGIAIGV